MTSLTFADLHLWARISTNQLGELVVFVVYVAGGSDMIMFLIKGLVLFNDYAFFSSICLYRM